MITQDKIQTKKKSQTSKIWYGNPQVELIEGSVTYTRLNFLINKNYEYEYNESELESIKQYIWEINMKNDLIKTAEVLCLNVPNKISINEFLNTISIYLSYINIVRVFKSPIPNVYFVYMQLKNIEYANILYNTFNYSKVNPIEKEYFIFVEVKELKFEEFFYNELSYKNSKRLNGIKVLVSPSNKSPNNGSNIIFKSIENFQDDQNKIDAESEKNERENLNLSVNNSCTNSISLLSSKAEINLCPICLDQIEINYFSINSLILANGIIHVLCGHIFHIECSLKLDDDKCPMCRYNLSPANISSCSLCSCENDLWMCLICGSINCGVEGNSNNHRQEHYSNSGHIYAKGLGDTHHVTFDFTKNAPLNILFQNSFRAQDSNGSRRNGTNLCYDEIIESNIIPSDSLYFKDPKEKVQFIVSEYNSIISSQLENQRIYYLNYMRKIDERYKEEEFLIDGEFSKMEKELEEISDECNLWSQKKFHGMEAVKRKENELKLIESELNETEREYKHLVEFKEKIEENKNRKQKEHYENLVDIENEIDELKNQIKDLNIHINTLYRISKKNSHDDISGATIEFMSSSSTGKKRLSKNNKNK